MACFLDADDCYEPGFFEHAAAALKADPRCAGIVTGVSFTDNHRTVHPAQYAEILGSLPSNIMVRRSVAELMGGFPEDAVFRGPIAGEDATFRHTLMERFRGYFVDRPFLRYRVRRGGHFDHYLDSTAVVDGKVTHLKTPPEAVALGARRARAAYVRALEARVEAVDLSLQQRPYEPRGLEMLVEYERLRTKFAALKELPAPEGYLLYRYAAFGTAPGHVCLSKRTPRATRAWLEEGNRATNRPPIVITDDGASLPDGLELRMIVLTVTRGGTRWIDEFDAARARLTAGAYVVFTGLSPNYAEKPLIDTRLASTGQAWSHSLHAGGLNIYQKTG